MSFNISTILGIWVTSESSSNHPVPFLPAVIDNGALKAMAMNLYSHLHIFHFHVFMKKSDLSMADKSVRWAGDELYMDITYRGSHGQIYRFKAVSL